MRPLQVGAFEVRCAQIGPLQAGIEGSSHESTR
jgi:hypothetical protein